MEMLFLDEEQLRKTLIRLRIENPESIEETVKHEKDHFDKSQEFGLVAVYGINSSHGKHSCFVKHWSSESPECHVQNIQISLSPEDLSEGDISNAKCSFKNLINSWGVYNELVRECSLFSDEEIKNELDRREKTLIRLGHYAKKIPEGCGLLGKLSLLKNPEVTK